MVNETNSDLNVAKQVNNDSEKKDEEVIPLENGYSSNAECPDWTVHPGIIDNFSNHLKSTHNTYQLFHLKKL